MAQPSLWALAFAYGLLVLTAVGVDALLAAPLQGVAVDAADSRQRRDRRKRAARFRFRAASAARPVRRDLLPNGAALSSPPTLKRSTLAAEGPTRAIPSLRPLRRGQIHVDGLWLSWRGPLGLARFVRRMPLDATIDVLPNVRGVQNARCNSSFRRRSMASRRRGSGAKDAVRSAARIFAGGRPRHIDWKHSARHRKLLVKEFDTERNHQVVMAFDTGHLMLEPVDGMTRLDHAINAGLLLAWIGLHAGDLVGTYGFDARVRQYMAPIRGVANFSQIQRATAAIAYHTEETNFTLGLAELERGSSAAPWSFCSPNSSIRSPPSF